MLSIVFAVTVGLGLIMSTAFIPSPIAIFIDFIDTFQMFPELFGHVAWFFPLSEIVHYFDLWFDVWIATLVTFVIMKIAKII